MNEVLRRVIARTRCGIATPVVGARGADGIVGGPQTVGCERRPNAARQRNRAGELLYPRGAVAQMVDAARVGGARNEQWNPLIRALPKPPLLVSTLPFLSEQ